ncbi:hypothetical protein D3C73_1474630 [compost metagenome]
MARLSELPYMTPTAVSGLVPKVRGWRVRPSDEGVKRPRRRKLPSSSRWVYSSLTE